LDYEHTRAERYGHPLSCIVVRLANSTEIAAASEDGTADRAMALIGTGLKGCIRAVDHLFRLRRNEFCILLPETDGHGAGHVLRRLDGQVEIGELWGGDVTPTPAVQIALTSTPEASVKSGDDLLKQTRHSLTRKD
jgi:GGDEF domain-containing protein